jgi:hypothetical protein
VLRAAEGKFGVNHPIFFPKLAYRGLEAKSVDEIGQLATVAETRPVQKASRKKDERLTLLRRCPVDAARFRYCTKTSCLDPPRSYRSLNATGAREAMRASP